MPSRIISNIEVFDPAFLARIERLTLQSSRLLRGGLSGEHASRRHLPAPTFSDHRAYSPGDDLRHIDWPAYARHQELHLKLGETEQDIDVLIALDTSQSLNWGQGQRHKAVYALRLAALVGAVALASNDHVQLWPFQTRLLKQFGPATGRGRTPDLLRFLSQLPFAGQTHLPAITRGLRNRSGGLLVLISDLWTKAGLDALLKTAAAPRWQTVVLHVLHPDEIRPRLDGPIELEDSETGATISLLVDEAARRAYYERLIGWVRAIERTCRDRGATYVGVRTDRSLERAIVPVLRRRAVLG